MPGIFSGIGGPPGDARRLARLLRSLDDRAGERLALLAPLLIHDAAQILEDLVDRPRRAVRIDPVVADLVAHRIRVHGKVGLGFVDHPDERHVLYPRCPTFADPRWPCERLALRACSIRTRVTNNFP